MPDADLAATLAGIRERVDATSRGPWVHDADYGYDSVTGRITLEAVDGPCFTEDLEFIAHARTDVPRLLAAVDAVLKLLEKPSTGIPPVRIREVITRELTKGEGGDNG